MTLLTTLKAAAAALVLAVGTWLGINATQGTPGANAPTADAATAPRALPPPTRPPADSSATYFDKLGLNITWAHDQRIDGNPAPFEGRFKHVRFFHLMEKDYDGGTPATTDLEVCLDRVNPWSCAPNSLRQNLVRVIELRKMFPGGKIWVAPEVIVAPGRGGTSWPAKSWSVDELGPDPELAGYEWAKAALATYGPVGGIILATGNEEWGTSPGRLDAYNAWRRGFVRAHKENPSCELALGASFLRDRNNPDVDDQVSRIDPGVWAYLNEIGGWTDYHMYALEMQGWPWNFAAPDRVLQNPEYLDFFAFSKWVTDNYPNVKIAVGEIGYTTSPSDVVPTPEQKRADWPTYRLQLENYAPYADLLFLYQYAEHGVPEGVFSGTGVLPELSDSVAAFAKTPLSVRRSE